MKPSLSVSRHAILTGSVTLNDRQFFTLIMHASGSLIFSQQILFKYTIHATSYNTSHFKTVSLSKKLSGDRTVEQRFCIFANDDLYHPSNETFVSVCDFNWLCNTVTRILYDRYSFTTSMYDNYLNTVKYECDVIRTGSAILKIPKLREPNNLN